MKWIRDIDLKVGGRSVTAFPFAQQISRKDCKDTSTSFYKTPLKNNDSLVALVTPLLKEYKRKNWCVETLKNTISVSNGPTITITSLQFSVSPCN